MIEWKVGDRVICKDDTPGKYRDMLPKDRIYSDDMDGLRNGSIYTIRAIETARVGSRSPNDFEEVDLLGIKLEEIYRKFGDIPFGYSRFELYERM